VSGGLPTKTDEGIIAESCFRCYETDPVWKLEEIVISCLDIPAARVQV
jgi:hypothetical protein